MRSASFAALSGLFAVGPLVSAAEPAIEEVVVTAQKRTENVQDVPLAVSVVSGAELERISALGIADLSAVVPSVTFNTGREPRDSSIRIRGVGTDVFAAGIEPSVSTVIELDRARLPPRVGVGRRLRSPDPPALARHGCRPSPRTSAPRPALRGAGVEWPRPGAALRRAGADQSAVEQLDSTGSRFTHSFR